MAEKLREELINDIMSNNITEGSDDVYRAFLELLTIEELQSHHDDLFENE